MLSGSLAGEERKAHVANHFNSEGQWGEGYPPLSPSGVTDRGVQVGCIPFWDGSRLSPRAKGPTSSSLVYSAASMSLLVIAAGGGALKKGRLGAVHHVVF
jgi:hypothetical protein